MQERSPDSEPRRPLRILCVSPFFPPVGNAEAFVAAKMVLALREAGAQVVTFFDDSSLSDPLLSRYEAGPWSALADSSVATVPPRERNRWATLCCAVRYAAWTAHGRWVRGVVRLARELHDAGPFHLVYSRSLPWQAHVAGYWCARALGVPWAVSINDPWDYRHFPGAREIREPLLRRLVSGFWLRRTLRVADVVTYPCARLGASVEKTAGVTRTSEVIPHIGWAAGNKKGTQYPPKKVLRTFFVPRFHLVHAGSLGSWDLTDRSPAALFLGLKAFLNVRPEARPVTTLTLVGPVDPSVLSRVRELGLSDVVAATGRVGYEESLRRMASASACILVEGRMEEGIFLPSKLADYVAAGKPVLALSPRVGTVADLAGGEPGILRTDLDDGTGIARALEGLYDAWRADGLASRRPSEKLSRMFRADRVAEAFLAAVENRSRTPDGVKGPGPIFNGGR